MLGPSAPVFSAPLSRLANSYLLRRLLLGMFLAANAVAASAHVGAGGPSMAVDQIAPVIKGQTLLWIARPHGHVGGDLYMQNLISHDVRRLTTTGTVLRGEDLSGTTVVWADCRSYHCAWSGNETSPSITPTVFAADLRTGRAMAVAPSSAPQWNPYISGTTVVWDERDRVYAKNLASGQMSALSPQAGAQITPCVRDNDIVWEQTDAMGDHTIYALNLRTCRAMVVAQSRTANDFPEDPLLDGHIVIWRHWHITGIANSLTIEGRNLDTGRAFVVAAIPAQRTNPQLGSQMAIAGHLVFWDEAGRIPYVLDDRVIYAKDIASGRVFRLALAPRPLAFPAFGGGFVAWEVRQGSHIVLRVKPMSMLEQ